MTLIVNGTEIENVIVVNRVSGVSTTLDLLQDSNGVEIWSGFKKLEQLIDRSIVSVSAEDLGEITSIGQHAFADCESLIEIIMPDSITTISQYAFRACESLTSVTIPSNVTTIGGSAFHECTNLTTIKLLPITPPSLSVLAIPDNVTRIEVPSDSLSAYQSANIWSSFADKMVGV